MNLRKKILYTILILLMIIFFQINISKAATVEVTTETLNLRREASTDSDIIILLSEGDECELLEEEGDWYKVSYGDYTGYISKEYAELQSDSSSNEGTTTEETNNESEETTTTQQTGEGTINETTNLRITPLITSSVLEKVSSGEKVTVISQVNGWSYIYTDDSAGWVRTDVVTIESSEETNSNNTSDEDDTNVDDSDNTSDEDTDSEETNTSDADFEERTMYTNDLVNIRSGPSTDSEVIMVVDVNTEIKVIGEEGDWYKVSISLGEAYISKELLSDERTTVTTSRGSSTTKKSEAETKVSTSNSVTGTKVVSYAKEFLGVSYVYGGASSSGFDCSGFTMYVYNNFGISLPHSAKSQSKLGTKVTANKNSRTSLLNNLEVGDLVFFLDYETMDDIGHCGIYIGDGNFIHASSGSGYCVKIDSLLPGEYYNTRYYSARRII